MSESGRQLVEDLLVASQEVDDVPITVCKLVSDDRVYIMKCF